MRRAKQQRLHFGGLWKLDHDFCAQEEARGDPLQPTVLFFLGDEFLLVTRLTYVGERLKEMTNAGFIYDVEPHVLKLWDTHGESDEPKLLQWRLVDRRYLELNEKGRWLRYMPTTPEGLAKMGVPQEYVEIWKKTFEDDGKIVILRPLAPDFGG